MRNHYLKCQFIIVISGLFLIGFLLFTGCQKVPPRTGLLEREVEGAQLNGKQLWLLLYDFVPRFSDRVEEAADQIIARATDKEIQKNALMWKINATSACFRTAARQDPLAAMLDMWVLCKQMSQFFEDGAGSTVFGPWQLIAIDTSRQLKEEIKDIAKILVPTEEQFERGRQIVNSFVEEAPIENLYFVRKSIASRLVQFVNTEGRALMEVVGDITENLVGLQKILVLYADHLPDLGRWQAELLLYQIERLETISKALAEFESMSESVKRMTVITELLPKLIEQERAALLADIDRQRIQSFEEIEAMRLVTLEFLQNERLAVFDTIREERIAAIKQLGDEIIEVKEDLGDVTLKTTNSLAQHSRELIDFFFWRVLQLGALFLVVIIIIVLLDRRLFQKK